jgi:ABC-type proline/glycine betaine transport system substrate-binding protein
MIRALWARESVGWLAEYTVKSDGVPVNITGWTFAQVFTRVAGAADVTLGMAANAAAQGFFVTDGAAGKYQQRILPATLAAIADTTGNFVMRGDIIATRPGGTRVWIEDQEMQVTEGSTP